MRRRRLPSKRGGSASFSLATTQGSGDFEYLERVVAVRYPHQAAVAYLRRCMANTISVRMVEAGRGESIGVIRAVEVIHKNGGERSSIQAKRVLADGTEASYFVPDHLVQLETTIQGAAKFGRELAQDDEVVLHVPVRGYLRFLPGVFQGDGPVTARYRLTDSQLASQQWAGGIDQAHFQDMKMDEDPLRRFLFIFQHVMSSVTQRIDNIADFTDPVICDVKFLPWLASWVGFDLDRSLPTHQQRELVRRAIQLFRTRGTKRGIEEMLRVLTSAPTRVLERKRPSPMVLGKCRLIGGRNVVERYQRDESYGCYLIDPEERSDTSFFTLKLEPRRRFQDRFGERAMGTLRRIVDVTYRERPAHVSFTVVFD